jgi:apolipoprotein N-acyltransferase
VNSLTGRYGGLLMLFAGAAGVTAFAPFGIYPVIIGSLLLLFNQWLRDTPHQSFRHGFLFGAGFFGVGVSWVFNSIHVFGHVPVIGALAVTVGLVVTLSLYPAILGYCLGRVWRTPSWAVLVIAFPAGWVFSEWLRSWLFTGFPWLNIANSQIDSPMAGYIPVLGVYGSGWLLALLPALLLAVLKNQQRLISVALLVTVLLTGVLLDRVQWTTPRGEAIQVSLVQGNISQEDKWVPENLLSTFRRYSDLTFTSPPSDLTIWPETAIPAFHDQVNDNFIAYLETELEKSGASLLTGIPVLERQRWEYYNAVIALGGEQAFYYKQHLVPYGEYLPMRWLIGHTLDALAVPNADFSSGMDSQPLLQAAGYPVATSICFEVVFGEQIIKALPEAAMLVNVSNDAWFGNSLAPHQLLEMARMRARETGRPMLRATNTGISAIIDDRGRITQRSPQFEIAVVTGPVTPMQGATPYVLMGNTPIVILNVVCLLLCWFVCRGRSAGLAGEPEV